MMRPETIDMPPRRHLDTRVFTWVAPGGEERQIYLSLGIVPAGSADAGRIGEIFIRGKARVLSEIDIHWDDSARLISHCLRHGDSPADLVAMFSAPVDDGQGGTRTGSILAAVCEELVRAQAEIDAEIATVGRR